MATRMREKTKKRLENKDTRPAAYARHISISPYKVRVVMDIVRGKTVNEAIAMLEHTAKAGSEPIVKLIKSAVANAEHNQGLSRADLKVAEIFADEGPTLKRIQPVSKGRAHRINKRTSHLTVILDTMQEGK